VLADRSVDAVLTEVKLRDGDGFGVLEAARSADPRIPVVILSRHLTPELLLAWASRGGYDCLAKPVDDATLDELLRNLQTDGTPSSRCRTDRDRAEQPDSEAMVIGCCPDMLDALKTAGAAAATEACVLVRGESGSGKELLAREIHRASGRKGPFVGVNCAAVVESLVESELFGHERGAFTGATDRRAGCIEQAHKGTVFLDEVGDASPAFQAKLLRALDRGEFYRVGGRDLVRPDVRVVAATNRNLEDRVQSGEFRQDLYYRLSVVDVNLPPLRDRRGDIPLLVQGILTRVNGRLKLCVPGLSEHALEQLVAYDWPGNVRELQNVLTRAALVSRGRTIQVAHLQGLEPRGEPTARIPTLDEVERDHIAQVLEVTSWNRGRSCELLGITRPTLRRKMRCYGLEQA